MMQTITSTNGHQPRLQVAVAASAATARSHVRAGWTPVEAAYGTVSVIDDLELDHHGIHQDRGPVSLRAVRVAHGARRRWPWFVTAGIDADATLAMAALAGDIGPGRWLDRLAATVAAADVAPHEVDLLSTPSGRTLLTWRQLVARASPTAAVHAWAHLQRSDSPGQRAMITHAVRAEQVQRRQSAVALSRAGSVDGVLVAVDPVAVYWADWYGRRAGISPHQPDGWDHPVIVLGSRHRGRITVAVASTGLARTLFGHAGLQAIAPLLGGGWGGRVDIIGSPRDRRIPADVDAVTAVARTVRGFWNGSSVSTPRTLAPEGRR